VWLERETLYLSELGDKQAREREELEARMHGGNGNY
jgi:hypothetical protein